MDPRADKVAGMLERMKLSEIERKGIKIGRGFGGSSIRRDHQAVGKVFTDKPIRADAIEAELGRVWCPLKGIECKELGENQFLFTFLQGSGKRRAMEDGPWMFSKDLVVLTEFKGTKTIDELKFNFIAIWVRISRMPLGLMTKEAREEIGEMIGDVLKVDVDDVGLAIG
jgi:hypothetical protein